MGLARRIRDWEGAVRARYNQDLSTPENRRRARIYNLWFDHAILRDVWTNFHEVAPGVYRSNHPTHRRFAKMKAMGIQTVLNLRGESRSAHYWSEEESCRQLGLTLISSKLHARAAASRAEILALIDVFRQIEKPFVMHCKSGADRAGFASAIWLMVMEGKPVDQARKMLAPRFMHLRLGSVAILDYILDVYAARTARDPIGFADWIATEYDRDTIQADFRAGKRPA
jgi:protein tyrosine/serine phosphatase